jgi:type I restriction enzyme S subunit
MINGLMPYPEYRPSHLTWVGEIPSHWEEKRAKYYFREVDERSTTGDEELLSVSHVTGVTPRAQKNVTMFKAESYIGHKVCQSGDLVINTMWAWMAAMGIVKQAGITSPSYGVYRPMRSSDYVPEYVDYLLRTKEYASEYFCRSTGIRSSRLRLYPDEFLDIPIVCPPRDEQRAMLAYLKTKILEIHRFTHNKERLIELLQEQKQAIISHAVTRGIDPDVRLKPSGIDWLGDVLEHWGVRRLKYLVKNVNEQAATKRESEVYIALEHVESWTGRVHPLEGEIAFDSQVKRFQPDDILFGKLRPYLAKVTRPLFGGVCVGEFLVLRTGSDEVLPAFLEQKLRSSNIIDVINSSTFGAKMPRADWTFIGNLCFSFPTSHDEQREIAMAIGEQTRNIDSAISHTRRQIDLIREYRTRLIADVVTGKVDVRGIPVEDVPEDEALEEFVESRDMEEALDMGEIQDAK